VGCKQSGNNQLGCLSSSGTKPSMPCDTRWCSHRDGFKYFVQQSGAWLCACNASMAPLERNFPTMSHLYGRKRDALGAEKADKVTFLYRSLHSSQFPTSSTRTLTKPHCLCCLLACALTKKALSFLGGKIKHFLSGKNHGFCFYIKNIFFPALALR